jgi:hypothetical protein
MINLVKTMSAKHSKCQRVFVPNIDTCEVQETNLFDHVMASNDIVQTYDGIKAKLFVKNNAIYIWHNANNIQCIVKYVSDVEALDVLLTNVYEWEFKNDTRQTEYFYTENDAHEYIAKQIGICLDSVEVFTSDFITRIDLCVKYPKLAILCNKHFWTGCPKTAIKISHMAEEIAKEICDFSMEFSDEKQQLINISAIFLIILNQ